MKNAQTSGKAPQLVDVQIITRPDWMAGSTFTNDSLLVRGGAVHSNSDLYDQERAKNNSVGLLLAEFASGKVGI